MIVTYRCEQCGDEFDGHWHRVAARRKQFPRYKMLSDFEIVRVCPKCGHFNRNAKNIDFDEVEEG